MDDGRPAIVLDAGLARWRSARGYVENIAAAVALAVADERAAGRVYNVGEANAVPEAEWARRIARATGWRAEIVVVPRDRLPAHLAVDISTDQHWAVDSTRIRRELGYAEPVPADEGLRRAVAWERAHPPEWIAPARFDYAAEDEVLAGLAGGRE